MEALYQYVWKHRMIPSGSQHLADGRKIEILDPGILNRDSGPDFFNGKILLDGTEWAGNIEVHVKASDWYRHGHHTDPAYNNVILHVVGVDDKRIETAQGDQIPQYVLTLPTEVYDIYSDLCSEAKGVKCRHHIKDIDRIHITDWFETMAMERLQKKAQDIKQLLESFDGDWEQTCFAVFGRALGFGLNSDPFELLTRNLSLKILHHHSDDRLHIEALLFGQAGMLDSSAHIFDEYYQRLCCEYTFLLKKYNLRPMPSHLWKFSRTRPQNFPHRRIALLADACLGGFNMFSRILSCEKNIDSLHTLMEWSVGPYWKSHYSFGADIKSAPASLSPSSRNLLIINVVVPLLYLYGNMTSREDMIEKALWLLEALPPERNSIIQGWIASGIEVRDAFRSQALIYLRKQYCDLGKCMYCRIGHKMLRKKITAQYVSS